MVKVLDGEYHVRRFDVMGLFIINNQKNKLVMAQPAKAHKQRYGYRYNYRTGEPREGGVMAAWRRFSAVSSSHEATIASQAGASHAAHEHQQRHDQRESNAASSAR